MGSRDYGSGFRAWGLGPKPKKSPGTPACGKEGAEGALGLGLWRVEGLHRASMLFVPGFREFIYGMYTVFYGCIYT